MQFVSFVLLNLTGCFVLLLFARLIAIPFSKKVRKQIRRHPYLHVIWLLVASAFLVWPFALNNFQRKLDVRKRLLKMRENTFQKISENGGWTALRNDCTRFAVSNDEPNNWLPWWVLPEEVTNGCPVFKALAPRMIRCEINEKNQTNVILAIYFNQRGGGHGAQQYYNLAVNLDPKETSPTFKILEGDKINVVTNGIFEDIWNF